MRRFQKLAIVLAGVFAIMGGLLVAGGLYDTGQVHDELVAQKIFFAPAGSPGLPANIQEYGGTQVTNGAQAKVFANDYIGAHVAKATGGLTYSEVSAKARANPNDKALQDLRTTAFQGEMLRSSLLNAYGWWFVGMLMFWGGVGLLALALMSIGVAVALPVRDRVRRWRAEHRGTALAH